MTDHSCFFEKPDVNSALGWFFSKIKNKSGPSLGLAGLMYNFQPNFEQYSCSDYFSKGRPSHSPTLSRPITCLRYSMHFLRLNWTIDSDGKI